MDATSSRLKSYQRSVQKPASLLVWGCISICRRYLERLHQCWKVCPGLRATYVPILLNHILHLFQQYGAGLTCLQEHHETQNTTKKTQDCWEAGILYQTRKRKHSLPKVRHLGSSVPRHPQTVVKRRGDATQWETWSGPSFLEMCCCHQIQDELTFFM